jgi:hypothetical protein
MKALSATTLEMDPYRAGIELADAVKGIDPEVVFLFSTIHYQGSSELTEAIYDVLDPNVVLIGGTGDGFFEASGTADVGAAVLALHSGGAVRWRVASSRGVGADSRGATVRCLTELREGMGPGGPDLVMLLSDFHADGTAVEEAIHEVLRCPVVGGLAGDNNLSMESCFTYANRQVFSDGVVALGMKGDLRYEIRLAHEMRAVGRVGTVTASDATRVISIDGLDAMAFVEREIGRPVSRVDQGIVTFNVIDRDTSASKYLRSILPDANGPCATPGLSVFGGIPVGARVQVCLADPEDIIAEVRRVAQEVESSTFDPAAALIVSCAGRKHLLGNRIEHEAAEIVQARRGQIALAGFPSFGEIGPVKIEGSYTSAFFHNMSYVLLLLGR